MFGCSSCFDSKLCYFFYTYFEHISIENIKSKHDEIFLKPSISANSRYSDKPCFLYSRSDDN